MVNQIFEFLVNFVECNTISFKINYTGGKAMSYLNFLFKAMSLFARKIRRLFHSFTPCGRNTVTFSKGDIKCTISFSYVFSKLRGNPKRSVRLLQRSGCRQTKAAGQCLQQATKVGRQNRVVSEMNIY